MRDRFLIAACLLGYWRSLSCNLVTHWYVLVRTMWKIIYQTMKTYFITLSLIAWSGQEEKKWKIKETAGRNFHTNQFLCRWKTINSKFINRFLTKSFWKKSKQNISHRGHLQTDISSDSSDMRWLPLQSGLDSWNKIVVLSFQIFEDCLSWINI